MSWILLALLAAFIWAVVNTTDKYILSKWVHDPMVLLFVFACIAALSSVVIFVVRGFSPLGFDRIFLAILAGAIYIAASFPYYLSVKTEEVSRVIPLLQFVPLFTALLAAIFLGELFTVATYSGVGLMIIGAFLITIKKFEPIRFSYGYRLMIVSAFGYAVNVVLIKYLLGFSDFWTIFGYVQIGAALAFLPFMPKTWPKLKLAIKTYGLKVAGVISLNELLNLVGVFIITIASSIGFITLVSALSSVQPFFVLLFAVILSVFYPKILTEEISKATIGIKLVAITLMFVGGIFII